MEMISTVCMGVKTKNFTWAFLDVTPQEKMIRLSEVLFLEVCASGHNEKTPFQLDQDVS